ncbi:MAG: 9-O-acetylesterase [Phycisphaerae bacterium]|nr:9-O-acetylesterase [Phycisphaerae bacterium]
MKRFSWMWIVGLTTVLLISTRTSAELKLPAILNDNMVLQRDMPIPIWGWTDAGQNATVTFAGQSATATADKDGKWMIRLPALQANDKPQTMTIQAGGESRKLNNILIGEVWLASGQSNMEWPVSASDNARQEIDSANHPNLRLFTVGKKISHDPLEDADGGWEECSPHTVPGFSAVAYFFGRDLLTQEKVPVGLIDSSWGGTPIEAWSSRATYAALGWEKEIDKAEQLTKLARENYPRALRIYLKRLTQWEKASNCYDYHNDGFDLGWANPDNAPDQWKDAKGYYSIGYLGAVWYRRTVEIPDSWAGKELVLELGEIDDYDTTYVNGLEVGRTDKKTPRYWQQQRVYHVPSHCFTAGKNTIAVRVFNNHLSGSFPGSGKLYPSHKGDTSIPLSEGWRYRVERVQNPRDPAGVPKPPLPQTSSSNANHPCVLYNGMIHPLIPYALRGAIWYQGESNAGNAAGYRKMLPAMIQTWHDAWGQKQFAFGIVQLANFMRREEQPTDTGWARLREAQAMTLSVPNTGLAVTIDIGDAADIHPRNKQDVGKRLALWARAKIYGRDIPYSGPMYKDMKREGNKIRLSFEHVNGGLIAKGDKSPVGFAIAGENGKFVWADAKIDGETVLVWSDKVAEPKAVRYAWGNNPACNLYNKADLPAVPFRTDGP